MKRLSGIVFGAWAMLLFLPLSQAWAQFDSFGGSDSAIRNVEPPAGSSLGYSRDANGGIHYEYTAPENFKDPIKIKFDGPNPRPDIFVWADVIRWNDVTQSATASGRIIVDDHDQYRIETTYVEYNHTLQQVYCPKRVKVIQHLPGGTDNMIVASSAILTLDDNGIKSAKFERILDSAYSLDKTKNPLKKKESSGEPSADGSSKQEPSAVSTVKNLDPQAPSQRRKTSPALID